VKRRKARERVLQILFEMDITKKEANDVINTLVENFPMDDKELSFIKERVIGTYGNLSEIDKTITKYLKEWSLSRLGYVDRAILRMTTFEILFEEDIPVNVSINEAVEIAKKYAAAESSKFINGVLGNLSKSEEKAISKIQTL